MRIFSGLLVTFIMLGIAQTEIVHLKDPSPVIALAGDIYSLDAMEYFDFADASFPVKVESNLGQTYNNLDAFAESHLKAGNYNTMSFIKQIHRNVIAVVFDDNQVVLQIISNNGQSFGKYFPLNLAQQGPKLFCTGFAYNAKRDYVYIGCFDTLTTSTDPRSIWIFTINMVDGSIVTQTSVKQDDGFRIVNRLQLTIGEFAQRTNGVDVARDYLFAYDQGHTSHKESTFNTHIRVFFNVNVGNLEFDELVEIQTADEADAFKAIHDVYYYQGNLIASGYTAASPSVLVLGQCVLAIDDKVATCSNFKSTNIGFGKIQITGDKYFALDLDKKTLQFSKLGGDFSQPDWTDNIYGYTEDVPEPQADDVWIREITGNMYGATVVFSTQVRVDEGTTLISYVTKHKMFHQGVMISEFDKNFIGCSQTGDGLFTVELFRNTIGFMKVAVKDLPEGDHKVWLKVTENLPEAEPLVVETTLTVIYKALGRVEIENAIGSIELLSHQTSVLNLGYENVIFGNALNQATIEFIPKTNIVSAVIERGGFMKIDLDADLKNGQTWLVNENVFGLQITDTDTYNLIYFQCQEDNFQEAICKTKSTQKIAKGTTWVNVPKSDRESGVGVLSGFDKNRGNFLYIMGNNGKSNEFALDDESIFDIEIFESKGDLFFYVYVGYKDYVNVYAINKSNIMQVEKVYTYDANSLGIPQLCIIDISSPDVTRDYLDILSICGDDSRILRTSMMSNRLRTNLPLPSLSAAQGSYIKVCSFGEEVVLASLQGLFSISIKDDFNYWTAPLLELEIANNPNLECLSSIGRFVLSAQPDTGKMNIIEGVGDQMQQQGKRFPVFWENLPDAVHLGSYAFFGKSVHAIETSEGISYLQSIDIPRVILQAGDISKHGSIAMELTIGNKEESEVFFQKIDLFTKRTH